MHVSEDGVAVCKKDVQEATGDDVVTCDRSTVTVTGRVTLAGQPGGGHLSWDAKVNSRYGRSVTTSYAGSLRRTVVVLPAGSQQSAGPSRQRGQLPPGGSAARRVEGSSGRRPRVDTRSPAK